MKISACMIVFQAESTLPKDMLIHCVESMLPHVHEFIIIEGATCAHNGEHKWDGDAHHVASRRGSSTDGTMRQLNFLYQKYSDKVKLIFSQGFWNGKTSMCNAYSMLATGDYIWHIDSDEFYLESDIPRIKAVLEDKRPDAVHFYANHFYGDFHHVVQDNPGASWANWEPWRRIFRHGPGFSWKTHEPPDYLDDHGNSLNAGRIISRDETACMGIKLYHYSQVCQSQADFKEKFFRQPYGRMFREWQKDRSTPLINGTTTVPFTEIHPKIIQDNYL